MGQKDFVWVEVPLKIEEDLHEELKSQADFLGLSVSTLMRVYLTDKAEETKASLFKDKRLRVRE